MQYLTVFFSVFHCFNESLQIRSPSSNIAPKQPPNVFKILPKAPQELPKTPPRGAPEVLGDVLGANFALLARSWPLLAALGTLLGALGTLLGHSWDSLGRSWALLGALGRSWDPLGILLARFRDLQESIWGPPELLQEASEQPKRTTCCQLQYLQNSCTTSCQKPSQTFSGTKTHELPLRCGGLAPAS